MIQKVPTAYIKMDMKSCDRDPNEATHITSVLAWKPWAAWLNNSKVLVLEKPALKVKRWDHLLDARKQLTISMWLAELLAWDTWFQDERLTKVSKRWLEKRLDWVMGVWLGTKNSYSRITIGIINRSAGRTTNNPICFETNSRNGCDHDVVGGCKTRSSDVQSCKIITNQPQFNARQSILTAQAQFGGLACFKFYQFSYLYSPESSYSTEAPKWLVVCMCYHPLLTLIQF